MPDITHDMLRAAFIDAADEAEKAKRVYGFLGDRQRASDPFRVPGRPGYVWCRVLKGGAIAGVEAVINDKVQQRLDLAVWMKPNEEGILEVQGTWKPRAIERYGNNIGAVSTPEKPAAANKDRLPFKNLDDLRPHADTVNGGLYLRIEPGWNGKKYYEGGSVNLATYQTNTSDRKAYAVIGLSQTDNSVIGDTSADRVLPYAPMPVSDIETVLATSLFSGVTPIAAVLLAESATTYTDLDIVDLRGIGTAVTGTGTGGSGWTLDGDATVPTDKDFNIVGTVDTASYTLTIDGELYIL